jgi:hypothetical protein
MAANEGRKRSGTEDIEVMMYDRRREERGRHANGLDAGISDA